MRKVGPLSHSAILEGFRRQSFAVVPFAISPEDIQTAVDRFFAFLALPQHVKDSLTYKHTPNRRGGRAGYKRSEPAADDPDGKEMVQYHRSMLVAFEERRKRIPAFDALLTSMHAIYEEGERVIRTVVGGFEPSSPGIINKFFPRDTRPFFHLRFLKYDRSPAQKRDFVSMGHYDIGSLTLAIAESAPGLRIGGDVGTPMTAIVHHPRQAVVMVGHNFPKEVSVPGITPSWHDVIQHSEQAFNDETARWAIVMFNDTVGSSACSWEESHTRRGSAPHEQLSLLG